MNFPDISLLFLSRDNQVHVDKGFARDFELKQALKMNNFPVFFCLTGNYRDDFAVDCIHRHDLNY